MSNHSNYLLPYDDPRTILQKSFYIQLPNGISSSSVLRNLENSIRFVLKYRGVTGLILEFVWKSYRKKVIKANDVLVGTHFHHRAKWHCLEALNTYQYIHVLRIMWSFYESFYGQKWRKWKKVFVKMYIIHIKPYEYKPLYISYKVYEMFSIFFIFVHIDSHKVFVS